MIVPHIPRHGLPALALVAGLMTSAPMLASQELTRSRQPFCSDPGTLRQFIVAAATRDERWMRSLPCIEAQTGMRFIVLERGEEDDGASIPKVRLLLSDGGKTFEGYTLVTRSKP